MTARPDDVVTALRRELLLQARHFRTASERNSRAATSPESQVKQAFDAWAGSGKAATYADALAAVLGMAARELGRDAAERLAQVTREVLAYGDQRGLNADVLPAPEAEQSPSVTGRRCE